MEPAGIVWPKVTEPEHVRSLFPRTIRELELFAVASVQEVKERFDCILAIPIQLRDFENTFYAIDFARALGNHCYSITRVVALTHTAIEVRAKALECGKLIQTTLVSFNSHRELYQGCLHVRRACIDTIDKVAMMGEIITAFEKEGAHLSIPEWERCRILKIEIQALEAAFLSHIEEDETSIWVDINGLKGVPRTVIDSFERRGEYAKIKCDTNNYFALICYGEVEKTRKQMYMAYNKRTKKNLPILRALIEKRRELAKLLGFASFAAYDISNQLAKTPDRVYAFLERLQAAAAITAEKEIAELIAYMPSLATPDRKIPPWNMNYLSALERGKRCQIDEEAIRVYFPIKSALPKALFYIGTLLKLAFTVHLNPWEGVDFHVEVKDEKGRLLGHILYDLFPRKGKYGHAYCLDVIPPVENNPAVAVVLSNYSSSLLGTDDLSTFLHETGHALHLILGRAPMPTQSGYRTPTDFIELPPLLFENLLFEPDFLKAIGSHHISGHPVSSDILKNTQINKNFGKGHTLKLQAALSRFALDCFHLKNPHPTSHLRTHVYERVIPYLFNAPIHYEASFRHLADPLYASKYYGFLFAVAHSPDVYEQLKADKGEWLRFRKLVLEKGGAGNPLEHLGRFLGREPSIEKYVKELEEG